MYSKVEISNIVFRGVEVKKSEIRLKSENLYPWIRGLRVEHCILTHAFTTTIAVIVYYTYSERGYFSIPSEILYIRIGQELKELLV